ncbi:CBS domain-containing protein [Salinarimonas sp.]|uniref:CBS domain-containing protein n=1 Tax=Salinarimonas sp. TaxID=2766526 RepID=UPI00391C6D5E
MTVKHVLSEKGGQVVTIAPARSLAEAAQLLAQRRIGAVVVSEDGARVGGILSERDIVRAVAREGAKALEAPVSAYMTRDVITSVPETPMDDLMEIMTTGKFRHVPILVDGRLAGIVSIGDVVKHRLAAIEAETQALKEYIAG